MADDKPITLDELRTEFGKFTKQVDQKLDGIKGEFAAEVKKQIGHELKDIKEDLTRLNEFRINMSMFPPGGEGQYRGPSRPTTREGAALREGRKDRVPRKSYP